MVAVLVSLLPSYQETESGLSSLPEIHYNCRGRLLIMEALLENNYNMKCDQSPSLVMQWEY